MAMIGRPSTPADRDGITSLMREALRLDGAALALEPRLQDWRYWSPHPLMSGSRGRVVEQDNVIVGHGCIWPIRLQTAEGSRRALHAIDWVANRESRGAGMKALRDCCAGMAVSFAIGGSEDTRTILPAIGFKPYNSLTILSRPLHPMLPAVRDSPTDWRLPARVSRNLWRYLYPARAPRGDWSATAVDPGVIPAELWPAASAEQAVSGRSPALLAHMMSCPATQQATCLLVREGDGPPLAYMLLVRLRNQVRLADYGPANLDERTCEAIGALAQHHARTLAPEATVLLAATSEASARAGFERSGLRVSFEDPIRALKLDKSLAAIERFRLTLVDWDALYL